MSGPKKGDVQLKLNRALDISGKYSKSRWDNTCRLNSTDRDAADTARNDASRKCGESDVEVRNAFEEGERLKQESERLKNEAENVHDEASRQTDTLKKNIEDLERKITNSNHYLYREDSQAQEYVREAENIEKDERRAADLLRRSSEQLQQAKTAFEQSVIIAEQKEEAQRRFEMERTAAANALQAVKNEAASFDEIFLGEWGGSAQLDEAHLILRSAEDKLQEELFEASQELSSQASKLFRDLYDQAGDNKKRFDSRELVVDAIIDALDDLQYDTPDDNYEPVDGIENTKLGNITIFAKSKGVTGDMRLAIDLNGNVDLEVANIPEGKEAECHNAITNLQSMVADVADLHIDDWGRAKDVSMEEKGEILRQTTQLRQQVKRRGV